MEQRLYDAAAKLPATNAKLDTSQMTGKIRATNSIGRVVITLAACAAAMCIILFGALSLASSVKEYNDAVAYFSMHNLSTDGLTRTEIRDVYKDIISGSFTHPKTADVLASKDNTEPQPTDPVEQQPTEPTDPNIPVVLPEYVPGTIKLAAKDAYTTWAPKDRQYRMSYYLIMGDFASVVRKSQPDAYNQWKSGINEAIMRGEWNDEMLLVSYIKHFNIPRASMEAALANYIYKRTPEQLKMEFYEAPNLDIIYTFDNEIINRYYRYELAATDPVPKSNLDPVTGLPIGVPEGFVFAPQDAGEITPRDRKYRVCYYQALGPFASLGADRPDEKSAILNERWEDAKQGIYRDEMWLVSIIKGLNIPREEFDQAVAKYLLQHDPENLMTEYYEIPNGDIIYTFDNEIINAYYRYEEPDWGIVPPELTENEEYLWYDGKDYHYWDVHLLSGPIYRDGYYIIWGEFLELANNRPGKSFNEWVKLRIAETSTAQACNEAALISFLKYFEVPKEDFEAALEKYISRHTPQELDWDYYWVLPDADIIYNFDNEIINQYYRKEDSNTTNPSNPTVPNPTEPTDPSEPVEPTDPEPTEPGPTEPCTHVWGQWIVVAEATCDQSGKQERSCDYCDEKQTQEIPKREHEESDWIIDKPADVGVEGHKHTECIRCHRQMREETIPAITQDHQHSATTWVISTYPGCTTSGTTQRVCSCGEVLETKSIAPLGHKEIVDKAVAATCITGGLTEGKHCSVCKAVLVAQQKVPATGHSMATKNVEATDKEPEYILHYCTACNYSYKETVTPSSPIKFKSNGNGTCIVTGLYDTTLEHVVIPEKSPAGDIVVAIGERAFLYNETVITITLPATVTEAGEFAFSKCTNLTAVYGSQHIATFAGSVFANSTALKEVDISGAKTIGNYLFSGCTSLSSVTLPEQLQTIPQSMFSSCVSLVEIPWPKEVKTIGNSAFSRCGVEHLVIPDTVEVIEMYAFRYCEKLQSVQLSGSVRSIGAMAFEQCIALKDVVFAEGLEGLGRLAFTSCDSLESVVLPTTVTRIGDSCFSYCSALASVSLPEGLTQIPESMFSQCVALKNVVFSSRLEEIGRFAFWATDITELVLPDSCVSIGQDAFRSCKSLKTVKFGKNLTEIESSTFSGCKSLTEVILPDCVQSIGMWAFSNCSSLKKVYLGNSITYIGSAAFQNCTGLTSVFLPKSLLTINPSSTEQSPFTGCAGTLDLYSDATNTNVTWDRYFGRVTCGVSYEEYLRTING